jgi:hypothetical protein
VKEGAEGLGRKGEGVWRWVRKKTRKTKSEVKARQSVVFILLSYMGVIISHNQEQGSPPCLWPFWQILLGIGSMKTTCCPSFNIISVNTLWQGEQGGEREGMVSFVFSVPFP